MVWVTGMSSVTVTIAPPAGLYSRMARTLAS
jgi:hypothetical protein